MKTAEQWVQHLDLHEDWIDCPVADGQRLVEQVRSEAIAACIEAAKGVLIGRTFSLQGLTPMQTVEEVERAIAKVGERA